jgi:hypothetical protein
MQQQTIDKLKQSYCLSLRADIGLGLVSDAFETLLYPSNELLKDYKGLVFIAIAPGETESIQCTSGLLALGVAQTFANIDAIVGYAELDAVIEYDSDRALQADADNHGYTGTLAELKTQMQCDCVFGYHFSDRKLLKDFIYDVGGAIGVAWQASDPQDAYHFRQAIESEVV